VIADKDGGKDPKRFEPEVIRDRLERVIIFGPLVKAALELAGPLSDTRLHLGLTVCLAGLTAGSWHQKTALKSSSPSRRRSR
jgi:hypothetical protein